MEKIWDFYCKWGVFLVLPVVWYLPNLLSMLGVVFPLWLTIFTGALWMLGFVLLTVLPLIRLVGEHSVRTIVLVVYFVLLVFSPLFIL